MVLPNRVQRQQIADVLSGIPLSCPATMRDWVHRGWSPLEDEFGSWSTTPIPDTGDGFECAMEALDSRYRTCWCGKFRAGLMLEAGSDA